MVEEIAHPNGAFVSVESASKAFAQEHSELLAVAGLTLAIRRNEVAAILGPSGCGKTTILRMIAGLLAADSGSVLVGGEDPVAFRQSGRLSFVFQKPTLLPWLTVIENAVLPSKLGGRRSPTEILAAKDLLQMVGLEAAAEMYPHELSGGMTQRATIARALITSPALLLLDEPFSALDEMTRERLWVDARRLFKVLGLTVLVVTHSTREAVFLADRVLCLSQRPGRVASEWTIELGTERIPELLMDDAFNRKCAEVRGSLS